MAILYSINECHKIYDLAIVPGSYVWLEVTLSAKRADTFVTAIQNSQKMNTF